MLFKDHHIEQIRNGAKTQTRRDWADGYARPNVGSVHGATTEMFQPDDETDCYIRIVDVGQEPLGELSPGDAQAEGGYTITEFRDVWREINGQWDPSLVVDVVTFEYVGRERPGE